MSLRADNDPLTIRYVICFMIINRPLTRPIMEQMYIVAVKVPPVRKLVEYHFYELTDVILEAGKDVPLSWPNREVTTAILELSEFTSKDEPIAEKAKKGIEEKINERLAELASAWGIKYINFKI